jgi:hypothetical protein
MGVTSSPPAWAGDGTCRASWCQPGGLDSAVDAMIDGQVAALGCDHRQRLTDRVAVRNTKAPNAGVVRVVDFDTAWNDAKAGKVWVVGWC